MIEGALADQLVKATANNTSQLQILQTMRMLLQKKQAHYSATSRNPLALSTRSYEQIAVSLDEPIKLAEGLQALQNEIKKDEELLKGSEKSKSKQQTLRTDHQADIDKLEEKQKKLEKRNGELSREIEKTPDKQIQELEAKIQTIKKSIDSQSELLPSLADNEKQLQNVLGNINKNVSTMAELESKLEEVKKSKITYPETLAALKEEQKKVRQEMNENKRLITDMKTKPIESIIAKRQASLKEKKENLEKQKATLRDQVQTLQNKSGITNEVRDLLKVAVTKMGELDNPPTESLKSGQRYR